jgi:hypothetical protein
VEKSHWVRKIAQGLDVPELALTDMLKKAKLGNRISVRNKTQADETVPTDDRQKINILLEELAGLMLVSGEIWKELLEKKEYHSYLSRLSLVDLMLKRGVEFNFDFNILTGAIDREQKLYAEKLFFRKKFRLDLNNNLEEVKAEEFSREFEGILAELGKEIKRIKLTQITKDLKLAESRKDKIALEFLRGEFEKVLAE